MEVNKFYLFLCIYGTKMNLQATGQHKSMVLLRALHYLSLAIHNFQLIKAASFAKGKRLSVPFCYRRMLET